MQHYTRNTVEASAWCAPCRKMTMHRIDGVKLGACLECIKKREQEKETRRDPPAKQESLFGGNEK